MAKDAPVCVGAATNVLAVIAPVNIDVFACTFGA